MKPIQKAEPPGDGPPGVVRYTVLGALCAAAALAYICRNCIGVAEEQIRGDVDLTRTQMGWVMGGFFAGYALLQIPGGRLGQVYGTRRMLSLSAALWSSATALTALADDFGVLLAAWTMAGAAQAALFPCAVNALSVWIPPARRSLSTGLLGSFMSVGGAAGVASAAFLLDQTNWRWMFVILAAPGLLWAAGFAFWFRDRPRDHPAVGPAELQLINAGRAAESAPAAQSEPVPWRAMAASRGLWLICGQQVFRAAGYVFYASWFPTFLRETRGVSVAEAGYLTSLPLLAVVLGSPVGGAVSDWVLARTGSLRLSRQGVAIAGAGGCALLVFAAYFIADPLAAVLVIAAGSFCSALVGACAYTVTMDMGGRHVPTVFAAMNMCGNLGAAACPPALERFTAAVGDWNSALFFFAGIYAAAAVCWAMLDPRRGIFDAPPLPMQGRPPK